MNNIKNINVEVILKNTSKVIGKNLLTACKNYLTKNKVQKTLISTFNSEDSTLAENVQYISIEWPPGQKIELDIDKVNWYFYSLNILGPQIETCEDDTGAQVNLGTQWALPSSDMFNLWENLIYDEDIKTNLLNYANSMMLLADSGVDSNVISYNRVILLHGPPGTGKTSLCRALAQKLSIRLQDRFNCSMLVEINSHSLFSKWFSESGKLVTKMFSSLNDIIADSNMLVFVLIDEIESLAHAREQCMSGNEPSDSIKVVNSMLTQLDQIKTHPNVLILTTSNLTNAIDIAFLDRADIKQYLGPPSAAAIFQIYSTCIEELIRTEIICCENSHICNNEFKKPIQEKLLMKVSEKSVGLSGRTLRKIPLLTHALFLKSKKCSINEFIEAMSEAVDYENKQRSDIDLKRKT